VNMSASSQSSSSRAPESVRPGAVCHWDLVPKADFILGCGKEKIPARFLFRDTLHAVFEIGERMLEFDLLDDGRIQRGDRVWSIAR
jgi:hypothetical protein